MGAQLANPQRRPLVLVGDAAFQMTGVELSTMVRYGLNPIIIIMNNGGYGSERPIHDAPYVDVLRWNYVAFTDLLGAGKGLVVKTEDELEVALMKARAYTEGFVLIDVQLEKFDYSPAFERFLSHFAQGVE
jgi:indolepyruvate decarboxylase